jgi:hypothetical protein
MHSFDDRFQSFKTLLEVRVATKVSFGELRNKSCCGSYEVILSKSNFSKVYDQVG